MFCPLLLHWHAHIMWARSGCEMCMSLECLFCARGGIGVSRLILLLLLLLLNHLTNLSILLRCFVRSDARIENQNGSRKFNEKKSKRNKRIRNTKVVSKNKQIRKRMAGSKANRKGRVKETHVMSSPGRQFFQRLSLIRGGGGSKHL